MKRFYSIVGALVIGATSLFAQTNYKVTFSANVEMDKIQVKNLNSGATKTLAKSDKVITLQKNAKQSGTPIESVDQFEFLQQTASNEVVVNMEKAGRLNLTLYSSNGTFVARYANNVDAGPNAFQIGASSGMYVLVASANNQTASLKILLTQSTQPSILEVLTSKPEPMLKSVNDVITFDEGNKFEFTGYYYDQTITQTAVISSDTTITFSFKKAVTPIVSTINTGYEITTDAAENVGFCINNRSDIALAPITECGVCWATTPNPTVDDNKTVHPLKGLREVGYVTISNLTSNVGYGTTYYFRGYAINGEGIGYGNVYSFTTKPLPTIVDGAIQKAFSVSATKKVYFSQGNLQYQASTGTWRFAERQYVTLGESNSNISEKYDGWIDLFGFGTSGWNSGAKAYQPYSTSKTSGDYCQHSLTGNYSKADRGVYNKISNGGNQAGMWRTLTSSEWQYLLYKRANASAKWGWGSTSSGGRGLIILPDDWVQPEGVSFKSQAWNSYHWEWDQMEARGAVFIPYHGSVRVGNEVFDDAYYYTSTYNESTKYVTQIYMYDDPTENIRFEDYQTFTSLGCAVRLVQDVK